MERREMPVYVKVDDYKDVLDIIEVIKEKITETRDVLQKINDAIKKIGDEGGYDFIFDTVAGNILYAQEKYDLTERVLEELRKSGAK